MFLLFCLQHQGAVQQLDSIEVEPDDHETKRAKTEAAKKQRIDRIHGEHEALRTVQFADESFHTMEEYDHDLSMTDHEAVELWLQEENDELPTDGVPNELWSDLPSDGHPPEPDGWIDLMQWS